jgi:predicted GNAT family acetyltransferase
VRKSFDPAAGNCDGVVMPWEFSGDVETYAGRVWGLLTGDPVEHVLALRVLESARAGHRWSEQDMLFGWYDDGGRVRGAVSLTPPYELLLAAVPDDTVTELVAALRGRAVAVPGLHGPVRTVERFVAAWFAGAGSAATAVKRLRLYALGRLVPPEPAPPGEARPAGDEDLDLALDWMRAFARDVDAPTTSAEPAVRRQIDEGRLWLWLDNARRPVALAARSTTAAGVIGLAPVYTPPRHRRRGYGSAVTAACTADALRHAERVVLFTDLANPTANSIYQQLGYRPVSDRHVVRFDR